MTESKIGFDTEKMTEQEWELVRLKPVKWGGSPEEVESSYFGIFVLLKKTRILELPYNDEYFVKFMPLIEVNGYGTKDLLDSSLTEYGTKDLLDSSLTWDVSVNIFQNEKKVSFAEHNKNFLIKDFKLRGRGLGSWIVSDLIGWTQKHYLNPPLKSLCIQKIDDKLPEDPIRRERFYEQFGFPAENVSQLREHRNFDKIENLAMGPFIKELLKEYGRVNQEKSRLLDELELQQAKINSLRKQVKCFIYFIIIMTCVAGLKFIIGLFT